MSQVKEQNGYGQEGRKEFKVSLFIVDIILSIKDPKTHPESAYR